MNKRLTKLKSLIDDGSVPTILEVRTNSKDYSYEDVIALDYGFVQDLYMGNENFETWFTYIGPKPIKLNDLTLNKNEMIEIILNYYEIL
ncbi:MAG: hypothetical protein QGH83_11010 [Candidatus Pacebacteria bacterium]|nr:hypothetical protein [Candidatus Paceibacterota bacterium]